MKILSISKTDKRSIYSVNKRQEFWKKAKELVNKLGLKGTTIDIFGTINDVPNGPERDIKEEKDKQESFEIDDNLQIDFIFGNKRIFIIFSYKKGKQKKISKIMGEIFKF